MQMSSVCVCSTKIYVLISSTSKILLFTASLTALVLELHRRVLPGQGLLQPLPPWRELPQLEPPRLGPPRLELPPELELLQT